MAEIVERADGVVLAVRGQPGARSAGLRGWQGEALKVAVTQVAEKGKANRAILDVLAHVLGLRRSQLELLAGEVSPHKQVLVRGITAGALEARIRAALESEA